MRMMNGAEEKLMWELERCFGRYKNVKKFLFSKAIHLFYIFHTDRNMQLLFCYY
jgi:hypothetical protein